MKFSKKLALGVMLSVMCAGVLPGVASAATEQISLQSGTYTISAASIEPTAGQAGVCVGMSTGDLNINFSNPNGTQIQNDSAGGMLISENPSFDVTLSGNGIKIVDGGSVSAASIFAMNNKKVTFLADVDITAGAHPAIDNGSSSHLIFNGSLIAQNNGGTAALIQNEGKLEINSKELILTAPNNGTVFSNGSGASLIVKSDAAAAETKQIIMGNINAEYGTTKINLKGNQSLLFGKVTRLSGSDDHFAFEDGARWTIPNNTVSEVNDLVLSGGRIDLFNDLTATTYSTLHINKLGCNPSKNNVVRVHTDLASGSGSGDRLTVSHGSLNGLIVEIVDKQTPNQTPAVGNVTVLTAGNDVTDKDKVKFGGAYYGQDAKVYVPKINEVDSSENKNYNFVGWEEGTPLVIPDPDSSSESTRDTELAATRDAASINVRDIESTVRRLNDVRTDPSEVGVWIRGERGENKIRNYSYNYSLMAGGYDWHIANDARSLFYGFGVTYSTNNCDDGVIGDSKSKGVNLYGSWLGKKHNDYVDVILKYGKLDKDYAGKDKFGVGVSGEYDKDLFVISTKYGRRFYKDNGFYFEPQVGYTYGRVGSADYTQKQVNGYDLAVHSDATISHIVSFDLQVGKNIKGTETYTKLGYVYDLGGEIDVYAPGVHEKDDMGGGYVRWTIGAARKVGKNNSFYIDVEKDFGSKVKKPYAVNLGYRHSF